MEVDVYCDDPECQGLLEWGNCPECGYQAWWHQMDVCPICDCSDAGRNSPPTKGDK